MQVLHLTDNLPWLSGPTAENCHSEKEEGFLIGEKKKIDTSLNAISFHYYFDAIFNYLYPFFFFRLVFMHTTSAFLVTFTSYTTLPTPYGNLT